MNSLQRTPEETLGMLNQIRASKLSNSNREANQNDQSRIEFDEFIEIMEQVQTKMAQEHPTNTNRRKFKEQQ